MNESDTMLAIRYHAQGGPEVLVLERAPKPEPGPRGVLVRVYAAGVNPVDWKMRANYGGFFSGAQLPATPGHDLAGVVEALGSGVSSWEKGQAVYGTGSGTYAEYCVAQAGSLAPKPETLSFDEAASVPIGAVTAWRALFDEAGLQPGQRVLIQGAAGGVGLFATQLAHWKGAYVIGTASSRNQDFVRSLGADEVVNYETTRFEEALPHKVDLVVDTVGGDVQARSWQALRRGGTFVTIVGQLSAEQAQAHGVRVPPAQRPEPGHTSEVLRQVGQLLDAGQVKAYVQQVLPLAEASRAHALSERGHGRGHVVLHVAA